METQGSCTANTNRAQSRTHGRAITATIINIDCRLTNVFIPHDFCSCIQNHLVSRPTSSVATRKVNSTLAQYFIKPISVWTQCIRSLVVSFVAQQPVLDDALDSHPPTWDLLPQLSDDQLLLLLDFGMSLADEAKKPSNVKE
jgi:hypothetical protein